MHQLQAGNGHFTYISLPPDASTIDFIIEVIKQINPLRSSQQNYELMYNAYYNDLIQKGIDPTTASLAAKQLAGQTLTAFQQLGETCADAIAPSVASKVTKFAAGYKAIQHLLGNPNKLNHIFEAGGQLGPRTGHNLDDLVQKLGSREAVVKEAVIELMETNLPAAGRFPDTTVDIAGTSVIIRGTVDQGFPNISGIWTR